MSKPPSITQELRHLQSAIRALGGKLDDQSERTDALLQKEASAQSDFESGMALFKRPLARAAQKRTDDDA